MRISSFINYNAAILAVLFATSCSKSPVPKASQIQDLGEIQLAAQTPKRVSLGGGKDLIFTQTALPEGGIRVDLDLAPKSTDAKYPAFNHAQFPLESGVK